MDQIFRTMWFALLLAFGGAQAQELSAEPTREDLFKWGEYDSLIREVESWLAVQSSGGTAGADSAELARANLQLGVAYWAIGRKSLGDRAFIRACRLDTALALNGLYATPQIEARFQELAAAERESIRKQAAAQTAARPSPAARPRKPFAWKWWAAGGLAAAGAAGGAWYYYLATLPPLHREKVTVVDVSHPPSGEIP